MQYGHVYLITHLVTGKSYIGMAKGLPESRTDYWGSPTHTELKQLYADVRSKHGRQWKRCMTLYFEKTILEIVFGTPKDLRDAERWHISARDAVRSFMYFNRSEGGYGGDVTAAMSPEEYQAFCEKNRQRDSKKISERIKRWNSERSPEEVRAAQEKRIATIRSRYSLEDRRRKHSESMKKFWAKLTPEERSAIGQKAHQNISRESRERAARIISEKARQRFASMTDEQKKAFGKKISESKRSKRHARQERDSEILSD